MLSLAGIPIPDSYVGHDLTPMMTSDRPNRDCVFIQISESQCGRAVRTPRYTYSVRARGGMGTGMIKSASNVYYEDFLYDLKEDPFEKHNLVKSHAHREVRRQLREMLLREMEKAGEPEPVIRKPLLARKK